MRRLGIGTQPPLSAIAKLGSVRFGEPKTRPARWAELFASDQHRLRLSYTTAEGNILFRAKPTKNNSSRRAPAVRHKALSAAANITSRNVVTGVETRTERANVRIIEFPGPASRECGGPA